MQPRRLAPPRSRPVSPDGPMRCGPRASASERSARSRTAARTRSRHIGPRPTSDDSRKPHVEFAADIEADLSRRDFTINAMALELTATTPILVDPFDGAVDLVTRTLRTPLSPEVSFSDDPLRMLRAARFIARYQLQPVPELDGGGHVDARPLGDRVRRTNPRRTRQADHRGAPQCRAVVRHRDRSCRRLLAGAARRCVSNRTRSTATRMC